MNIEAYKEHTKMKTISSNYVSTMTLPQQRYLLTARKLKINQALLWDSSIEYNEDGYHFLVVKMKIPKTTFFKDYGDNRYVVFYDSNGHLVEYIYELWARKSASNPQNYYNTVKDVFLCNKLNSKTKSTDFNGYVFVYNNDYRQIGSYDVKHKKLSVSNIKALLDFNEKKGSVDSSSLNFIKNPKLPNLLSLPKTNASYYCIEYRATWITAGDVGDEAILNIVYFGVCYPNCQSIAPHKPGDFQILCDGGIVTNPEAGGGSDSYTPMLPGDLASPGPGSDADEDGLNKDKASPKELFKTTIKDSLKILYPCLDGILDNLKNVNVGVIIDLFNAFLENPSQFNVTVSATDLGEGRYGLTRSSGGQITIYLNSYYLTGNNTNHTYMTNLGISATLIHEFIHAYIRTTMHIPQTFYSLNFPLLLDTLFKTMNPTDSYHEWMQQIYFRPFISALQSLYPNIPLDYLEKLAWSGLQGTNAWKSLTEPQIEEIKIVVASEKRTVVDYPNINRQGLIIICN